MKCAIDSLEQSCYGIDIYITSLEIASIMDKSVETLNRNYRFQTNHYILCLNENTFFICNPAPLPPTSVANASWMFICFQHWKRGKGGYLSWGERGEFTLREKGWSLSCVSTTVVHDCCCSMLPFTKCSDIFETGSRKLSAESVWVCSKTTDFSANQRFFRRAVIWRLK